MTTGTGRKSSGRFSQVWKISRLFLVYVLPQCVIFVLGCTAVLLCAVRP